MLEDSEVQRNLITECICRYDREVFTAESIRDAKAIFNNNTDIDLIILDLQLPDGNGIDFLKYARKSSKPVRTIVESAFIPIDVQKQTYRLGVIAFFEKPFIADELAIIVGIVLPEINHAISLIARGN